MKFAIVGAGAVGSVFGYLLAKAGREVWLVDPNKEHINAIHTNGLQVSLGYYGSDQREECSVRLNTALAPSDVPGPVDVVILLVKGTITRVAMEQVAPILCGPETVVLSLQNGLGNPDIIAEYIDARRIAYGTTMIASGLTAPGCVKPNLTGAIDNHLGSRNPELRPVLEAICEDLTIAGSGSVYEENIDDLIGTKLAKNCSGNGLLAILRINGRVGRSFSEYTHLQQQLLLEVDAVAKAKGINCEPDTIHPQLKVFPIEGSPIPEHLPSTAQDVKNHRATEIDFLNGAVVREGRKLGVPTPYNDMVASLISIIENSYAHQF